VEALLTTNRDFNATVKRNIVSLRTSEDLFDDLTGGDEGLTQTAQAFEALVKDHVPPGVITRGFHYSTAIEYPFVNEPYLQSRYGNGTYPVWYGSPRLETTIYETCYHMARQERGIEGLAESVYRERAVYDVDCRAVLIDLSNKQGDYPQLIEDSYGFTQNIGQRLQGEGHPGLIAPSARLVGEDNVVIFKPSVLDRPRISCYLSYLFDPSDNSVTVEREPGVQLLKLAYPL